MTPTRESGMQAGAVDEPQGPEDSDHGGELFAPVEREELERRWNEVQARFVDEPRGSVEEANALVDELMKRLVSSFSEQRAQLEAQWDSGDEVTTEDLRVALRRYRSFFGRLLEVRLER
ncbi:MAG TPA: hypothetical protein VFM13_08205 [Gaiellaceae bacterium]|nr:hypothetical protein [Gaiellaceae bacterium]